MRKSVYSLLLAVPVLLMGCAERPASSQPQHVYSDAEVKAFALKALSASDMNSDLYARYRRALTEQHHNDGAGS